MCTIYYVPLSLKMLPSLHFRCSRLHWLLVRKVNYLFAFLLILIFIKHLLVPRFTICRLIKKQPTTAEGMVRELLTVQAALTFGRAASLRHRWAEVPPRLHPEWEQRLRSKEHKVMETGHLLDKGK